MNPNNAPWTLIVDGAHLLIDLQRQANEAELSPGIDLAASVKPDAIGMSFMATLASLIATAAPRSASSEERQRVLRSFYELNGRLSVYIFDAQQIDAPFELAPTGFAPRNRAADDLYRKIYERRVEIYKSIVASDIAFPGDPGWVEDDEQRPYDMQINSRADVAASLFTALDVPTAPGVYFGYLAERGSAGFAQKAVDTMIALCGAPKAQEGRSIALVSADTDYIPLANYVLSAGRRFKLLHTSPLSEKWRVFSKADGFSSGKFKPALLFRVR